MARAASARAVVASKLIATDPERGHEDDGPPGRSTTGSPIADRRARAPVMRVVSGARLTPDHAAWSHRARDVGDGVRVPDRDDRFVRRRHDCICPSNVSPGFSKASFTSVPARWCRSRSASVRIQPLAPHRLDRLRMRDRSLV